ncbi:MmcQ/YjbR family DNA-binding protein [Streptomyces sp. NPDC037389]|uniref:MmcQ/YjbR family DNA-binding protein n=1 Tax=Streptomyces sp. NPDC037389 TaxID=3155369 RepID=UPI0033C518D3
MIAEKPVRRRDPRRRIEEIAAATEKVIAEHGIEGVTHRLVAETAGVPLGATTYHFATKGDLITAALRRAVDRFAVHLDDWTARHADLDAERLPDALADVFVSCFDSRHGRQTVEFELYLAALRRPELRPLAEQYTELSVQALSHHTDPLTATATAAAMSGLTLRGLAGTGAPRREDVTRVLRRVLTPVPAGAGTAGYAPTPPGSPPTRPHPRRTDHAYRTALVTPEDVAEYALALPEATEHEPSRTMRLYKTGGKIFAVLTPATAARPDEVALKCDPALALHLREQYPAVRPGRYGSRHLWNTVILDGTVPDEEIADMIEHSWHRTVDQLPEADRDRLRELRPGRS